MKDCTHCGAENIDENFHCVQCSALLPAEPLPYEPWPLPFVLWPRSAVEWTRSLASALLLACFICLCFVVWVDHSAWRYLVQPMMLLLTILGGSLVLFCIRGKSLPKGFRVLGLIVGTVCLSFLGTPVLPIG
jgi:hypothetical protein